ncbi:MAG: hypothetical protein ACREML_02305 [Vulcanimicrobiaceae bacterium]
MFGEAADPDGIVVRSLTLKSAAQGGRQTLVAAAPIEKVRRTLQMTASCGLRAVSVDHEACVLARASQLPLLDVGLERSTLVAANDGVPVVRSFELGGAFFSDAMAREFVTSLTVAEVRKRTIGLGGAATESVHAYIRALALQTEGIAFDSPPRLYVCGNGARLASLREQIAETLCLRVVPADVGNLVESDLPREVMVSGGYDWFGAIAAALPRVRGKAA